MWYSSSRRQNCHFFPKLLLRSLLLETPKLRKTEKLFFKRSSALFLEWIGVAAGTALHRGCGSAVVGLYFNVINASAAPSFPPAHLLNWVKWRRRREVLEAKLMSLHAARSRCKTSCTELWQAMISHRLVCVGTVSCQMKPKKSWLGLKKQSM